MAEPRLVPPLLTQVAPLVCYVPRSAPPARTVHTRPTECVTAGCCAAARSRSTIAPLSCFARLRRNSTAARVELCEPAGCSAVCSMSRYGIQLEWRHVVASGWFEGRGASTFRASPPGPLSIPYGHVGCLKARAFPPLVRAHQVHSQYHMVMWAVRRQGRFQLLCKSTNSCSSLALSTCETSGSPASS
jgi:hypothetical protein